MEEKVKAKFLTYPLPLRQKLEGVRGLILSEADAIGLEEVEETLKWGEPAYLVKGGSTLRFDWKEKVPDQYALYFNCNTKLVDTFREIYGDLFNYEGNRAIVFNRNDAIPEPELRHCIRLCLTYHKIKHLPLLGA